MAYTLRILHKPMCWVLLILGIICGMDSVALAIIIITFNFVLWEEYEVEGR